MNTISKGTVLLVSANDEVRPCPVYPLAIAKLAAAVESAGYRAVQYDLLAHGRDRLAETLRKTQPDMVGLSLRNIDTVDSSNPSCFVSSHHAMVQQIRACTHAPVVLGGSGFSIFPEQLMALLQADFGVVGPGERALTALLDAVDQGTDPSVVPGVCTRASSRVAPEPAQSFVSDTLHDPAIIDYYWRNSGMIGFQTKQGCPRSCSYCTYPLISGRRVLWGDPEALAGEVEKTHKEHGVTYFFMVDSVFNISPEPELAFAEALCRRDLGISWGGFFSPANLDRTYLETLRRSGLTHIEFGTDSLSGAMLDSYRKGFCVSDVIDTTQLAESLGIHCAHYLMFGGPGETMETIAETMANARELKRSLFLPFAGIRVYPNTPLFEQAIEDGVVCAGQDLLDPVFYFSPGLDAEKIWRHVRGTGADMASWLLPFDCDAWSAPLRSLRDRGVKGPLWEYASLR